MKEKFKRLGRGLSKEEQRQIKGGVDGGGGDIRMGYCLTPVVGCWHYINPVDYATCQADIQTYCSSGLGSCITTTSCPS
jgi:hypothetical protein